MVWQWPTNISKRHGLSVGMAAPLFISSIPFQTRNDAKPDDKCCTITRQVVSRRSTFLACIQLSRYFLHGSLPCNVHHARCVWFSWKYGWKTEKDRSSVCWTVYFSFLLSFFADFSFLVFCLKYWLYGEIVMNFMKIYLRYSSHKIIIERSCE